MVTADTRSAGKHRGRGIKWAWHNTGSKHTKDSDGMRQGVAASRVGYVDRDVVDSWTREGVALLSCLIIACHVHNWRGIIKIPPIHCEELASLCGGTIT